MNKSPEAERVQALKERTIRAVLELLAQMTGGEAWGVRLKLYSEVSRAVWNEEMNALFPAMFKEQNELFRERRLAGLCTICGEPLPEADRLPYDPDDLNKPSGLFWCAACRVPLPPDDTAGGRWRDISEPE